MQSSFPGRSRWCGTTRAGFSIASPRRSSSTSELERKGNQMSQDKRRPGGFTRRKFMKTAAVGAAATAGGTMLAAPAQAKTNQHPDPDVILINGRIHPQEAKNTIAS